MKLYKVIISITVGIAVGCLIHLSFFARQQENTNRRLLSEVSEINQGIKDLNNNFEYYAED